MESAIVAVLGLIIGSFLNALIYRLSVDDSVARGRSYCPKCRHALAAKDLIPVLSFIFLRGQCRYCKSAISLQYPLVELATALALIMLYDAFGSGVQFFFYAILAAFLIVIFTYDLLHYLILDRVIIPAVIVALIGNLLLGVSWLSMLGAALVGGGFFALQFIISKGAWIGGGDIRLGFLMGVILGWPNILVALFIAYITGSIIGVALIMRGKKSLQSKVPFGTFLTVGTFISMLYGAQILGWYLDTISL